MPGAVDRFDDRVADRLHEAVDQRGGEVGTGGRVDAAGRNETVFLRPEELGFPVRTVLFFLVGGQRQGNAATDVMDARFLALGVLLDEDFYGDFLFRQRTDFRCIGERSTTTSAWRRCSWSHPVFGVCER